MYRANRGIQEWLELVLLATDYKMIREHLLGSKWVRQLSVGDVYAGQESFGSISRTMSSK